MAIVAVVTVSTAEESLTAAQIALPDDVFVAMFLTVVLSPAVAPTILLSETERAQHVLLLRRCFHVELTFAVYKTTEEWLPAGVALVIGELAENVGLLLLLE